MKRRAKFLVNPATANQIKKSVGLSKKEHKRIDKLVAKYFVNTER